MMIDSLDRALNSSDHAGHSETPYGGHEAGGGHEGLLSKSERIRRFLRQHPEARNRDVVEALLAYGVTAADVGNVKNLLRKKEGGGKPAKGMRGGKGRVAPQAKDAPVKAAVPAPGAGRGVAAATAEFGFDSIEAGVEFIQKVGGLDEAQQILNLIRQIRSIR